MATRKLPPPIIDGVIPASYGNKIIIPYQMNKSVSKGEFTGFQLIIKNVQSNTIVNTFTSEDFTDTEVKFKIWDEDNDDVLTVGQFYKVQLSYLYINEEGEQLNGYYSTVAVMKYSAEPVLTIIKEGNGAYLGKYTTNDPTEKVYSYSFDLINENNQIVASTGDKIHNSYEDIDLSTSIDRFVLNKELKNNSTYYLRYSVMTNNKIKVSVNSTSIVKNEGIDSVLTGATIITAMNREEGYIDVSLKGAVVETATGSIEKSVAGNFTLLRSSDEDNYETWYEVVKFDLFGQQPSSHLWKDMTVSQGVSYKYAIQQYNKHNVKSSKLESKEAVYADFDHAFLYDGERQLKIKYNPKISSFKNTLQEAKVETIGSKYPFIFRNGSVNYKEFPISGLISYHSDENALFLSDMPKVFEGRRQENDATAILLNDLNDISLERKFKMEVLEWLSNGKPKLFRSPVEGNYIVRLMNVSLSPNDTLGRMLHSFNCTAYEVAEASYESLSSYNFIKTTRLVKKQLRWTTVELKNYKCGEDGKSENLINEEAVSILFNDMEPGTQIQLSGPQFEENENIIRIGATGTYSIDLKQNIIITNIQLLSNVAGGSLTYAYYSNNFQGSFDMITKVESVDVPSQQFIGRQKNIIKSINNIKNEIASIGLLRFYLRPAELIIFKIEDKYYTDLDATEEVFLDNTLDIFQVYYKTEFIDHGADNTINIFKDGDIYYSNIHQRGIVDISKTNVNYMVWEYVWVDGYNNKKELGKKFLPEYASIRINGEKYNVNIMDTGLFYYPNPQDIISIEIGDAVVCEISYRKKQIEYEIEASLQSKDQENQEWFNYLNKLETLKNNMASPSATPSSILLAQRTCITAYDDYLELVEKTIAEREAN